MLRYLQTLFSHHIECYSSVATLRSPAAIAATRPPTMRAAILEKFNTPYTIKDIPIPLEPKDHDILVKVLAASYCHTDAVFASGQMSQDLPRVGCHEFAGEIESLGPLVSSTLGLSKNTKVGIPGRAYHPCGECLECKLKTPDPAGYSPYCIQAKNLGLTADGGFQEYCLVDSRQVAPIPTGLTALETAPLMCAGLTVWAALQHEAIEDAKSLAIMGAAGGLGHLGVQFAARLGKRLLAVDVGEAAVTFLERIVGDLGDGGKKVSIIDARKEKAADVLRILDSQDAHGKPQQKGVDAVIVLPEAQAAMDYGISLLKNHGTVIVIGFPENGFNISAKELVFRDIRILGSLVGRNFQLRDMLKFAAEHNVRAKIKAFPLEQLNYLVKEYHKAKGGKLVIDMTLS